MTNHFRSFWLLLIFLFGNASITAFMVLTSTSTNERAALFSQHSYYGRRYHRNDNMLRLSGTAVSNTIETFFITQPYLSAFLTCSFKASAADWIAQTQPFAFLQHEQMTSAATESSASAATNNDNNNEIKSKNTIDLSRNVAFLLYGGLYQGMAQQFMYSRVFPDMFGHGPLDMTALASQVAFDMAIVGPFLCLPTAYIVKSLFAPSSSPSLNRDKTNDEPPTTTITASALGLDKYVLDVTTQGLLLKYWGLWTPVNFVTFSVVPPHFRVAFVAAVSFFWVFVLSSVAGSSSTCSSER